MWLPQQIVDDRSEREEGIVFERLEAIKHLREEMRRIESEGQSGVARDVSIPAGWLLPDARQEQPTHSETAAPSTSAAVSMPRVFLRQVARTPEQPSD